MLDLIGRTTIDPKDLVFISSQFQRARETSEECMTFLQTVLAVERAPQVLADTSMDMKETDLFILKLVITHLGDPTLVDVESPVLQVPGCVYLLLAVCFNCCLCVLIGYRITRAAGFKLNLS